MEQPLAAGERALHLMDAAAPICFTVVGHVRGPLDEARVREGLGALQARHPALRARIVDVDGEPCFRPSDAALLLRTVHAAAWEDEAARELNARLPFQTGPLARAVLVSHAADAHTLLLTIHHAIGDGISGAHAMRDLVQACGGGALEPLAECAPAEERTPHAHRGSGQAVVQARFLGRELARLVANGPPLKIRPDQDVPPALRTANIAPQVLEPEAAARLAERARAERTTVHGALGAAMLLAVLDDARASGEVPVTFASPASLRRVLEPAVGHDLGFFVSMVTFGGRIHADEHPWALARAIRAAADHDLASGVVLGPFGVLATALPLLGGGRVPPEVLAARLARTLPSTTGITNIGRVEVAPAHGDLELTGLHFLANPSALADFIATATSFRGALRWNFVWSEPYIAPAHGRRLAQAAVERLRHSIAS